MQYIQELAVIAVKLAWELMIALCPCGARTTSTVMMLRRPVSGCQKSPTIMLHVRRQDIYIYIYMKMSLKQHGHFATNGFMFPLFRQMLQNTEKSTLNLWIVVNGKKCKRFPNSKPIMGRSCIYTFIYERSFLACQTFQISNFTLEYTQLTSQNAHTSSYKATYHNKDTIYY